VQVIESLGRTVTADLADLDGDGALDLLQVVTFGMPPRERRLIRIYLQDAEGRIPGAPTLETPLPSNCAAYDLADVDGVPGQDLLLLRPRGIRILSFGRTPGGEIAVRSSDALIPEDLTVGIASDERGLDRLALVETGFGDEPWLVAPGLGETFFLSPGGELRARVASGVRANFFVESSGLIISESDIQVFLDAPRISVGDVNGVARISSPLSDTNCCSSTRTRREASRVCPAKRSSSGASASKITSAARGRCERRPRTSIATVSPT